MLPLLLQLRHESDESFILPQTIQVGIVLKKWVAREAIVGGELKPFNCLVRLVEQRISRSDVVSRMMEMRETFADINRALDRFFRLALLAGFGENHCFDTGHVAALVV